MTLRTLHKTYSEPHQVYYLAWVEKGCEQGRIKEAIGSLNAIVDKFGADTMHIKIVAEFVGLYPAKVKAGLYFQLQSLPPKKVTKNSRFGMASDTTEADATEDEQRLAVRTLQ